MYLDLFPTKMLTIPHLNGKTCFIMCAVSYKTKTFLPLNADILNGPSTKGMKELVEIS